MKLFYFITMILSCALHVSAQTIAIHPQPKQQIVSEERINIPATYRLVGNEQKSASAIKRLKTVMPQVDETAVFSITVGVKGESCVRKYGKRIPKRAEGYYLKIDKKGIVIAGSDRRGAFYGVQTLLQLQEAGTLPVVEITDYPDIRYRGVVEGFYGTPWSHAARLRQLDFYGDSKMNTYIYGPKDDPYHSSPNWRQPYPEQQAQQIMELVTKANENEVDFVWAIHPGKDIQWNDEDRQHLLNKFEKMYDLGVRSYAVFFDDITGEGTNPQRQAELLNYLDDHFVKVKGDVTPLVMCPTEYNRSWVNPKRGYLTTLGSALNPSIQIMWTGDRVIATINKEGVAWINEQIKRPAYIWWNFPVSDYVRDHLLMGEVYGNDLDIADELSGFVTNPMEHAEASKIAIYSVADYAWHMAKYDSLHAWERAIKVLMPTDADALRCFAEHNADLGENGHLFRRDESKAIAPIAQRFCETVGSGNYRKEDFDALVDEFARISEAASRLLVNKENRPLVEEIKPWLLQFQLMGETGTAVLALLKSEERGDDSLFMRKYRYVCALRERSYNVDQQYNQNPYQPGVKCGGKILQPLISQVFTLATQRYNSKRGILLDAVGNYAPHKLTSDVAQLAYVPIQVKNNRVLLSPLLEVIKWPQGNKMELTLDKVYQGKSLEIDFGGADISSWGSLEVTCDGKKWQVVELPKTKGNFKVALPVGDLKAIRFTNIGTKEQELYLRKFILTLEQR